MTKIIIKISLVLVLITSGNLLMATTTYYSMSNGSWASTIWSTTSHAGPSCACQPAGGCNTGAVVNIYNTVTVSGCSPFQCSSGTNITLFSGGKLIISGNLTLNNNAVITVPAGDSLIVNGNFVANASSHVIINGYFKITGSATLNSSAQVTGSGAGHYASLVHNGSSCWCIAVHRDMVSFTAERNESNTVNLNWATESESNIDYFTIDKSIDKTTYVTVAKVNAITNSDELQNYGAVDNNPYEGGSYYRLVQTDVNGNSETISTAAYNFNPSSNAELIIYPNPSDGKSISIITTAKNIGSNLKIYLYDIYGRVLTQKTFPVSQETMNLTEQLALPQLNPGIYFIKGMINNKNYSVPFLVK